MNNYRMVVYCVETTSGLQWNVEFPEVNGCGGAGTSVEEAIADAKINLEAHLEFLREDGIEIPEPKDMSKRNEYSGKISLRLTKSLHKDLAELADAEGMSINNLINIAVAKYIGIEAYNYNVLEQLKNLTVESALVDLATRNQLNSQLSDYWKSATASIPSIICIGGGIE